MHSKSLPPALQEAEYFTLGLHIPQGAGRLPAHNRPAPGPSSNGVPRTASDNLSLPISFPPMSSFSYTPTTGPPPSLEEIRSSTKSLPKTLYTEAKLSHDSPFGAFQDARKGSSSSASASGRAAVIGRDQANANRSLRMADSALPSARPPSFGGSFAGRSDSNYPATLSDLDFLAGSSPSRGFR